MKQDLMKLIENMGQIRGFWHDGGYLTMPN